MDRIGFPIVPDQQGDAVESLHRALETLGAGIDDAERRSSTFGSSTGRAVLGLQRSFALRPTGLIDEGTAKRLNEELEKIGAFEEGDEKSDSLVRGQVVFRGGRPVPDVEIQAVHVEFRADVELGTAKADERGRFQIHYSSERIADYARERPDLQVRVYGPAKLLGDQAAEEYRDHEAERILLAESRIVYSARTVEKMRLRVSGGDEHAYSEFEQLESELAAALGDRQLSEVVAKEDPLRDAEVKLLAGKTGQPMERIALMAISHKLAERTGVEPAVFYALAREGHATRLGDVLALERAELTGSVAAAAEKRIIPPTFKGRLQEVEDALRGAAIGAAVGRDDEGPLSNILTPVLEDGGALRNFVALAEAHVGSTPSFWENLADDAALGDKVPDIQLALQFATLTGNHAPLVNALISDGVKGLHEFVGLDAAAWRARLDALEADGADPVPPTIPGDDLDARKDTYARTLVQILQDVLPSETFAHAATQDVTLDAGVRQLFEDLLDAPDVRFNLGKHTLDDLEKEIPNLFEGLDDPEAVRSAVRPMQLLYRLTPRYAEVRSLLGSGYDSAFAVSGQAFPVFLQQMAPLLSETRATTIYAHSTNVAAYTLALASEYASPFNRGGPLAAPPPNAPDDIADIETLFGSMDLCACRECRSVHGPAAYFAELLAFLDERPQQVNGGVRPTSAFLFDRRPDLAELELTCENTNTVLPYVDLANEILEDEIAPFQPFRLPAGVEAELDQRTFSAGARAAILNTGWYEIGRRPTVVVVTPGEQWFVTDRSHLYRLELDPGDNRVWATVLARQSSRTSGELRAYPEHLNPRAYDRLRTAFYPWSLPFDLWTEEARIYLDDAEVERADLMTTFRAGDAWAADESLEIATERLGFTQFERELITGGSPVRVATTGDMAALQGLPHVDGVALAAGDLVLVAQQGDPRENDIYEAAAGAWRRVRDPIEIRYVTVTEGNANAGQERLVRTAPGDHVWADEIALWELFGLDEVNNDVEVYDPAVQDVVEDQLDWIAALGWVRTFLSQTGLEYQEMLDLLQTRFANPADDIRVVSADPDDLLTCDTAKLVIENLDAAVLDRMHRFVRLWKGLGWSIDTLDSAIAGFQPGVPAAALILDEDRFHLLARVSQVAGSLAVPVEEILAFWSPLDTHGDQRSFYAHLFRDPSVESPLNPAFEIVGGELSITVNDPPRALVSTFADTIRAVLQISAVDLEQLSAAHVPGDALNLASLSTLYRYSRLARALGVAMEDLLTLESLSGLDPFDPSHPEDCLRLSRVAAILKAAEFSVSDLDYVLRGRQGPRLRLTEESVYEQALSELRLALTAIREETTPSADPEGKQTARSLAALRWPEEAVTEFVEIALGRRVFQATLAALPPALTFPQDLPAALAARVTYDATEQLLAIRGPLTTQQRLDLRALSPSVPYRDAVDELFDAPRSIMALMAKAFEPRAFRAPLGALPAGVAIPVEMLSRVWYDPGRQEIAFIGIMSDTEKAALDALDPDAAYRAAVQTLYDAARAYVPAAEDQLLTAADVDQIIDGLSMPEERFALMLGRVLPHLRHRRSRGVVAQWFADLYGMPADVADVLTSQALTAPGGAPIVEVFLHQDFVASHPEVGTDSSAFPGLFAALRKIEQAAMLVDRLKFDTRAIDWLLTFAPDVPPWRVPWARGGPIDVRWLDLDQLPQAPVADGSARLAAWLRTRELMELRRRLPRSQDLLEGLFRDSRELGVQVVDLLQVLSDATGWTLPELQEVTGAAGLDLDLPAEFQSEMGLTRLFAAFRLMRRLRASGAECREWSSPWLTAQRVAGMRGAAKSRYSESEWLEVAAPLRDQLRDRQRVALAQYLIRHPPQGSSWANENDLYAHYLIDVEMTSCMDTSRLKQALSSTQLFIQRCLMNLERPDVIADREADAGWDQYRWMKNYRVWEVNRKIFLYPENWIEAELRDDKTPFFEELESSLLQEDVDQASAQKALTRYLRRLSQVSRLEVVGQYTETRSGGRPSILHVIARTNGIPASYFHRTRIGTGRWTPWTPVELDIGDAPVLPIVWNRQLYLFWLLTNEAAEQAPLSSDPPETPPTRFFELQLAWSTYEDGKWKAKKLSNQKVRSRVPVDPQYPDRGRSGHVLRANAGGRFLHVWYEHDTEALLNEPIGTTGYDNTVIYGDFVWGWLLLGCDELVVLAGHWINGIFEPKGTVPSAQHFLEKGSSPLWLPKNVSASSEAIALSSTPGSAFRLSYAHQDEKITGERPFFFQDNEKTFFVESHWVQVLEWVWTYPEWVSPVTVALISSIYYSALGSATQSAGFKIEAPPVWALAEAGEAEPVEAFELADRDQTKSAIVMSKGDSAKYTLAEYIDPDRVLGYDVAAVAPYFSTVRRYRFHPFYHEYVCALQGDLLESGPDGLYERANQLRRNEFFEARYSPTSLVERGSLANKELYPVEDVDFTWGGAYSQYNWELFLHIPMLIATRLAQNQRFEEAQRWFHYIFNPTHTEGDSVPQRYWITRPFYEYTSQDYHDQRIDRLIEMLATGTPDPEIAQQVSEWRNNPFKPHAVARLRPVAYQKAVVMKYLDNLVAWGDQLFRRDSIESINEATQIYVLAAEILGEKPREIAPRGEAQVQTYTSLRPELDRFSNALVSFEYLAPAPSPDAVSIDPQAPPLPLPKLPYFCVPPNANLLEYWRTITDRLWKIRTCRNIEGKVRPLALFEPPIDPALLVRAAAAGLDIGAVLNEINAVRPNHRFTVLVQRALDLSAGVTALGSALLSALDRRDTEELSRLQNEHESAILDQMEEAREEQLADAEANTAALRLSRAAAASRYLHHQRQLGAQEPRVPPEGEAVPEHSSSPNAAITEEEGTKMFRPEKEELKKLSDSNEDLQTAGDWEFGASLLAIIPTFSITIEPWGVGGSISMGGSNFAAALQALANRYSTDSQQASFEATRAGRLATHIGREDDRVLQNNQAAREIMQIDGQIAASLIKEAVATVELESHRTQIEQAEAVRDVLEEKFTNQELYGWMVGQLSEVYFQSYQLAYDAAKQAERAYRFEIADETASFVRFGHWDGLRKGLLAGERLRHDLDRMNMAFLDEGRREYELTKHISLSDLHPEALVELRATGACEFRIPEVVYDLDHPGHYMRRIKALSVSLPCVAGPYTSVPGTLTMLGSRVRARSRSTAPYSWTGPDDNRFAYNRGGIQSIATSTAERDTGLFELNFRDERYLPFEGSGAIADFRFELPRTFRPFSYDSIADLVLHVQYTARDGGDALRDVVVAELLEAIRAMEVESGRPGTFRHMSLRHDLPAAWHDFLHPPQGMQSSVQPDLDQNRFPHYLRDRTVRIKAVITYLKLAEGVAYDDADPLVLSIQAPTEVAGTPVSLESNGRAGGLPAGERTYADPGIAIAPGADWSLTVAQVPVALRKAGAVPPVLDPVMIDDIGILWLYTL